MKFYILENNFVFYVFILHSHEENVDSSSFITHFANPKHFVCLGWR